MLNTEVQRGTWKRHDHGPRGWLWFLCQEIARLPFDSLLDLEAKDPLGTSGTSGTSASCPLPLREPGPGLGGRGRTSRSSERPRRPPSASKSPTALPEPGRPGASPTSSQDPSHPACRLWPLGVGQVLSLHGLCRAPGRCPLSCGGPRLRGRGRAAGWARGSSGSRHSRGAGLWEIRGCIREGASDKSGQRVGAVEVLLTEWVTGAAACAGSQRPPRLLWGVNWRRCYGN